MFGPIFKSAFGILVKKLPKVGFEPTTFSLENFLELEQVSQLQRFLQSSARKHLSFFSSTTQLISMFGPTDGTARILL